MPREYREYLADILTATQAIEGNVSGVTYEQFAADTNRVKAVLLDLAIIGEACRHIPVEVRARAPAIEWEKIVGLRNVIVHGYWLVNHQAIWETARANIPELRQQAEGLLKALGGA